MSDIVRQYKDSISFHDKEDHSGLWARTEVLCSNGDVIYNPYGKSTFAPGSPFTKSKNMVVIGGCQYVMEKLFGFPCDQITIPTLYEMTKEGGGSGITASSGPIGRPDSTPPTETYPAPNKDGERTIVYRYGNIVQCFGIGTTGVAENDVTVHPVDYREKSIDVQKVNLDGNTVYGTMLPFRYTSETLSKDDRKKYFGKIKGPVLDRIDIHVAVEKVAIDDLKGKTKTMSSADMFSNKKFIFNIPVNIIGTSTNKMTNAMIKQYCELEKDARQMLNLAYDKYHLSARGYYKIIKVARTIADMERSQLIERKHILEAIGYRNSLLDM